MNYKELPNVTSAVRLRTKALVALSAVAVLCLALNPVFATLVEHGNGARSSPASFVKSDSRFGITWHEVGDAGDLPDTAQVVTGVGLLDNIVGTLNAGTDIDMYQILVTDPESFSAITHPGGTHLSQDNDAQLFIFDAAGFLVSQDDDDGVGLLPAIYPGELEDYPPGLYYVAFDLFNIDPGDDPITYWTGQPAPPQTGSYEIYLTAARVVPEPATLLLLGLGGLAVLRRQRSRRNLNRLAFRL